MRAEFRQATIVFDTDEMQATARLMSATASHYRGLAQELGREQRSLPPMPTGLRSIAGSGIAKTRSSLQTLAEDVHVEAVALAALAQYIEAEEKAGRTPYATPFLVEATFKTVEVVARYAKEMQLPEQAAARVLAMGADASIADDFVAKVPRLAKILGVASHVLNFVGYLDESGDWDEAAWRTGFVAAGAWAGAKGGAAGAALACGLAGVPTGGTGWAACIALGWGAGGAAGAWAGDKIGDEAYAEETKEQMLALFESVENLPAPARSMVYDYLETGEYSLYEALRAVEMQFGMLDDPQIDDDPLDD